MNPPRIVRLDAKKPVMTGDLANPRTPEGECALVRAGYAGKESDKNRTTVTFLGQRWVGRHQNAGFLSFLLTV